MSGDVVVYEDKAPAPYRQDPEPQPSLEQDHAASEAFQFDERLFLTAPFVRYRPDGTISGFGEMGYGHIMSERIQSGGILVGTGMPDAHYVDREAGAIREKAPCPAVRDGLTLSGLPVPCVIEIGRATDGALSEAPALYDWSEPSLILAFDHPGEWTVRVLSAPHLTATFTVRVDG